MDVASNILAWIILGSFMLIDGIVGIFKHELSFHMGRGRIDIPISLKGKFGLASSISLIIGGALVLLSVYPFEWGFGHVLSALGCIISISVVCFCIVMQTLLDAATKNYQQNNKEDSDH
jgi:hypothetical protein